MMDKRRSTESAEDGNTEGVRVLLDAGADPNARAKRGETPLHHAKRPETVQALLNAGADPNACTDDGRTPLHCTVESNTREAVQALLEAGADPNARGKRVHVWRDTEQDSHHLYETPLYLAGSRDGATDIVQTLIDAGADVTVETDYGQTLFQFALKNNDIQMVEILLSAKPDLNTRDRFGRPLLHLAALGGNHTAVQLLIDAGADPSARTKHGQTPLHLLTDPEQVRLLNQRRRRPERTDKGRTDTAPLRRTRRSLRDSAGPVQFGSQPEHKKFGRANTSTSRGREQRP